MSTPDNHGKKAPQFAAFKPLTTVQNTNDCCCDGACSSTPTLSENVSGTAIAGKSAVWTAPPVRAKWKMPCASLQA